MTGQKLRVSAQDMDLQNPEQFVPTLNHRTELHLMNNNSTLLLAIGLVQYYNPEDFAAPIFPPQCNMPLLCLYFYFSNFCLLHNTYQTTTFIAGCYFAFISVEV